MEKRKVTVLMGMIASAFAFGAFAVAITRRIIRRIQDKGLESLLESMSYLDEDDELDYFDEDLD